MAGWGDQLGWRGWEGVGTGDDKPPQWEASLRRLRDQGGWSGQWVVSFPAEGRKSLHHSNQLWHLIAQMVTGVFAFFSQRAVQS